MTRATPAQASFWAGVRRAVPKAPAVFTAGRYTCPLCGRDRQLKIDYAARDHKVNFHCFSGCDRNELRKALGVTRWADLQDYGAPERGVPIGAFTYTDTDGTPLFKVERHHNGPPRYLQRDDGGDWAYTTRKRPYVLYRAPEVAEAIETEEPVYLCATEADADAVRQHGGAGTATPEAPNKGGFRVEYAEALRGAYVVVVAVKHEAGRERARQVAAALSGRAADVRVVEPAIAKDGATAADHLDRKSGRTLEDFRELQAAAYAGADISGPAPQLPPRCPLEAVEKLFGLLVSTGDKVALRATLACYAANLHLPGDAVWLGLVAGSSTGKTETVTSLARAPGVFVRATLSGEAALLSGTPAKDWTAGATGGLLRRIGDRGVLVLKDFTSVLSMHREKRGQILAALREIADGHWSREIGGEGGALLEWRGKLGLVMACTTAYDRAHEVIASMGDRFLLIRLDDDDPEQGLLDALEGTGQEGEARAALADAAAGLLGHPPEYPPLDATPADRQRIAKVANVVTLARSPVARDYRGEIELVMDREAPHRFGKALFTLWRACGLLGMTRGQAWEVANRVARDSMPKLRWRVLKSLTEEERSTNSVAMVVNHPAKSTRRALEDLAAHGVIKRTTVQLEGTATKDFWRLTEAGDAIRLLVGAEPEMSGGPQEEQPA
jgi:hypothetical protein